jgi:hypothetical protein
MRRRMVPVDDNTIRERLRSVVGTLKNVRLTRPALSDAVNHGFVVAIGREWVLLQQFHDFYPEGYSALRIKDIKHVRSGKNKRLWERMLAAEGLINDNVAFNDGPLDDVSQLMKAIFQRGDKVIVECEERAAGEENFFVGKLCRLSLIPYTLHTSTG